jgi:hypothetical protein
MNDDQLRRLFSDAVSDVEPDDRLDQIRASVHPDPQVVAMSRTRPWRYAALGVAATVAVIGGVAWATGSLPGGNQADNGTPVGPGPSSHHSTSPVTPPTSTATSPLTTPAGTAAYPVYYVGQNPSGRPVLFREFHSGPAATTTTDLALSGLVTTPLDPDYHTDWPAGSLASARWDGTVIDVVLGRSAPHVRPASMSSREAEMALQQVVYTAQAAVQKRSPVQFLSRHGKPVGHVFGLPTSTPLTQGQVLKTLSLVNISNPNERAQVSGQLKVTGVNNAFEGTSVVYLERDGKKYLVTPVIGGFGPDQLYPWTASLAVSTLQPGEYTLVARNDDPSGHGHPPVDTRTVIVK